MPRRRSHLRQASRPSLESCTDTARNMDLGVDATARGHSPLDRRKVVGLLCVFVYPCLSLLVFQGISDFALGRGWAAYTHTHTPWL